MGVNFVLESTIQIIMIFLYLSLLALFTSLTFFFMSVGKYFSKNKDRISRLEADMIKLQEKLNK
ncbi:hypothetical protein [Paenibacillus popilliae]|uniref:DUF4083 domain-containing protein n=2 Tax=Paenibacillus popilliae TaxID=78057 RepID=M9M4Z9_PAEPP|nr:hypothetical protein [Paenibacillus popilliae]BAQ95618.1 hypothetical protein [Paenibacillus popilliae ATCC 14706]GAC42418.1 hypothetical protein PPOP_1775 [Paenibacillus popilliae ATCC 14706]